MADDFEVAGVLDSLNRADQGTWHLVCRLDGGRKTGAWAVEDRRLMSPGTGSTGRRGGRR